MKAKGLNINGISLDRDGAVILSSEDLAKLERTPGIVSAGGLNDQDCGYVVTNLPFICEYRKENDICPSLQDPNYSCRNWITCNDDSNTSKCRNDYNCKGGTNTSCTNGGDCQASNTDCSVPLD